MVALRLTEGDGEAADLHRRVHDLGVPPVGGPIRPARWSWPPTGRAGGCGDGRRAGGHRGSRPVRPVDRPRSPASCSLPRKRGGCGSRRCAAACGARAFRANEWKLVITRSASGTRSGVHRRRDQGSTRRWAPAWWRTAGGVVRTGSQPGNSGRSTGSCSGPPREGRRGPTNLLGARPCWSATRGQSSACAPGEPTAAPSRKVGRADRRWVAPGDIPGRSRPDPPWNRQTRSGSSGATAGGCWPSRRRRRWSCSCCRRSLRDLPGHRRGTESSGREQAQRVRLGRQAVPAGQLLRVAGPQTRPVRMPLPPPSSPTPGTRPAAPVTVSPRPDVQLLDFSATAASPDTATAVANAYAEAFSTFIADRQQAQREGDHRPHPGPGGRDQPGPRSTRRRGADDRARAAPDPGRRGAGAPPTPRRSSRRPRRRTPPLSPQAGLRRGAGLPAARHRLGRRHARSALTDRYANAEEAAHDLGLPVLAQVSRSNPTPPRRSRPSGSSARACPHALREHVGPVLMVTSATPGSGKTHISINMAQAFAAEGRRVILVDCDFRRPAINKRLGIPVKPGHDRPGRRHRWPEPEMAGGRLPSGRCPSRGQRVPRRGPGRVRHPRPRRRADHRPGRPRLRQHQRPVRPLVIDSPPTLPVVDPLVIAHYADGVLFVVDGRRTAAATCGGRSRPSGPSTPPSSASCSTAPPPRAPLQLRRPAQASTKPRSSGLGVTAAVDTRTGQAVVLVGGRPPRRPADRRPRRRRPRRRPPPIALVACWWLFWHPVAPGHPRHHHGAHRGSAGRVAGGPRPLVRGAWARPCTPPDVLVPCSCSAGSCTSGSPREARPGHRPVHLPMALMAVASPSDWSPATSARARSTSSAPPGRRPLLVVPYVTAEVRAGGATPAGRLVRGRAFVVIRAVRPGGGAHRPHERGGRVDRCRRLAEQSEASTF